MFISDETLKAINEKYLAGDYLDDNELLELLSFYERLERDTKILGPHFHLAWIEIRKHLDQLEGFYKSRPPSGLF